MSSPSTNPSNTNIDVPETFDEKYKKIAESMISNKNSSVYNDRSYRIAGIINLQTGNTRDMFYQVDLGNIEELEPNKRTQSLDPNKSIAEINNTPDYSKLANPVDITPSPGIINRLSNILNRGATVYPMGSGTNGGCAGGKSRKTKSKRSNKTKRSKRRSNKTRKSKA